MKTLIKAWTVALLLYSVSPLLTAQEGVPAGIMHVWTGFSEGRICITVRNQTDQSDAQAEFWLVNNTEVEWIKDVEGYSCIDLDFNDESSLHVITYDPGVVVSAVVDDVKQVSLARN